MNAKFFFGHKAIFLALLLVTLYFIFTSSKSIYSNLKISHIYKAHYQQINNEAVTNFNNIEKAISHVLFDTNQYFEYGIFRQRFRQLFDQPLQKVLLLRPNWGQAWARYAVFHSIENNDRTPQINAAVIALKLTPNDLYVLETSTTILFSKLVSLNSEQKRLAFDSFKKLQRYSSPRKYGRLLLLISIIQKSNFPLSATESEKIDNAIKMVLKKKPKATIEHAIANNWHEKLTPLLTEKKQEQMLQKELEKARIKETNAE